MTQFIFYESVFFFFKDRLLLNSDAIFFLTVNCLFDSLRDDTHKKVVFLVVGSLRSFSILVRIRPYNINRDMADDIIGDI